MDVLSSAKRARSECKRWSKEDKLFLLQLIQHEPKKFEKPTANIYYNKIISQYGQFVDYGWKGMRDKMRNLKQKYIKAKDWRRDTGSEIDADDAEKTIRETMLKLCEDFDELDIIFGCKSNITPTFIFDNEAVPIECQPIVHLSEDESNSPQPPKKKKNIDNLTSYLVEAQKGKTEYLTNKLAFESQMSERKMLLEEEKFKCLQEAEGKKLEFQEKKFREETRLRELKIEQDFTLKKIKLENELHLKELELTLKYNNIS